MVEKKKKSKKANAKAKSSEAELKAKDSKLESKEEVCEVFEVEKKGEKEQEKRVCSGIEKRQATKEELKRQNKTLRNILIGLGIIVLLVLLFIHISNSAKTFNYRGVSGNVVKEGNIIFYRVAFPVKYQGKVVPWSIYIRNDPRKLDKIPFEGEMDFGRKFNDGNYRLVLNISDDFECGGYESISIGNMINLQALGIKVVKDENATCDPEGRYMYINIKKGEESKITQVGDACYDILVKDCEILETTERFMVEMFVKYYE